MSFLRHVPAGFRGLSLRIFVLLTLFRPDARFFGTYANSGDPVQTPLSAASDQGLHCFLPGLSMKNTFEVKKITQI